MIVTMLEAAVAPDRAGELEKTYRESIGELEPGIVETFLLRPTGESTQWRICTVWESREALQAMRQLGTPTGVLIFRVAGAEPSLSIFEVAAHAKA